MTLFNSPLRHFSYLELNRLSISPVSFLLLSFRFRDSSWTLEIFQLAPGGCQNGLILVDLSQKAKRLCSLAFDALIEFGDWTQIFRARVGGCRSSWGLCRARWKCGDLLLGWLVSTGVFIHFDKAIVTQLIWWRFIWMLTVPPIYFSSSSLACRLFLSKYGHFSGWLLTGTWSQARWVTLFARIILLIAFARLRSLSLRGLWKRSLMRSLRGLCLRIILSLSRIARCCNLIFGRHFFLLLTDINGLLWIHRALRA